MRHALRRIRHFKPGVTFLLVLLGLLWLLPTLGVFVTSFRTVDDTMKNGWWNALLSPFSQNWTLDNYSYVIDQNGLVDSFISTFAIAFPATVLPIMIATYAAFGFTFFDFKGKNAWFAVLLGLMVIPQQVAFVPIIQLFVAIGDKTMEWGWFDGNGLQIMGEYPAAWLVHIAFAMPLATYLFRNYMMTLPVALIEAARIDGANYYQIFWRLIIPMSVPALASFGIFQFLWVWNDYLVAFFFVSNHTVLQTALYSMMGTYGDGWQYVAAGSFVSMLFPLVVFFSLQRFFVRGLTGGSVK